MKSDRTRPQVTLEQLLHVKRAEQPSPEFWQQFEREMRVKQLAAIVEPRPWWAPFIRVSARMSRYQVPVGATAILALSLLTIREYQVPSVTESDFAPAIVERVVETMPGPSVAVVMPATPSAGITSGATMHPSVQSVSPEGAVRNVTMLGGTGRLDESDSPTARMIAANLEAVKTSAPELAQLINRVTGMEGLIAPRQQIEVVDPLARVTINPDRRSNRLLASALPVTSPIAAEAPTGAATLRFNRSLTEERLYDSVSRFGFNANRVAIKF